MNELNIHNNITGISSFLNGLNHPLGSTGFYFKSKIVEDSREVKKCFFNCRAVFLILDIFEAVTYKYILPPKIELIGYFFPAKCLSNQLNFWR